MFLLMIIVLIADQYFFQSKYQQNKGGCMTSVYTNNIGMAVMKLHQESSMKYQHCTQTTW